jgi:RimJ/RimL family protein N-acetyltransferase
VKIRFEKLDLKNEEHLISLAKWDSDLEFKHLVTPVENKHVKEESISAETIYQRYSNEKQNDFMIFIVYDQEKPIGNVSLRIDPSHLYRKAKGTSWLGLVIGNKEYWGTGAAQETMDFFEKKSIELGLKRIELGVFTFNERARKFYLKLDYKEIGRIKDFTYWQGKFWDDIRMEKLL